MCICELWLSGATHGGVFDLCVFRKSDGDDEPRMGDGDKGLTVFYDINVSNDTDSHGSGSEHNKSKISMFSIIYFC